MLSMQNASYEAAEKTGQSSVLEHRQDPGVIDTGICIGKVSQKDTCVLRNTVGQSGVLNLKDVVCRLPGGDASVRGG